MAYENKKKKVSTEHFPETIPICYMDEGKLIVPPAWELYYCRCWKWKQVWGFKIEAYKAKYLAEYEAKNGKITNWEDHTGNLRPIRKP